MWKKEGLDPEDIIYLDENRVSYATISVSLAVWTALIVRTTFGSRLPFIYMLSSAFVIFYAVAIVSIIFGNWNAFGDA